MGRPRLSNGDNAMLRDEWRRKSARRHQPSARIYLGRRGTEEEHFWVKVEKTPSCWFWIGARVCGYGYFRNQRAHRWAYEHTVGPIPGGLTLDHLCGVRNCVNPAHMEPVTASENIRRYHDAR